MFRLIRDLFKTINSFLNAATKASEALGNSIEEHNKSSQISLARKVEEYKKEKAQMVIDGGYESEEAMDKAHEEIIASVSKRSK